MFESQSVYLSIHKGATDRHYIYLSTYRDMIEIHLFISIYTELRLKFSQFILPIFSGQLDIH